MKNKSINKTPCEMCLLKIKKENIISTHSKIDCSLYKYTFFMKRGIRNHLYKLSAQNEISVNDIIIDALNNYINRSFANKKQK